MPGDAPREQWNPHQYARFRTERSQPFFDLLALVQPRAGMRVADLGCGTGELTSELHRTLHARQTIGVDTSAAMLAESRAFAGNGLSFERLDLREFLSRPANRHAFDLVVSNAALQRIPDQAEVLERITEMLVARAGQLAIQVPDNADHPSHVIAREVAMESPFREASGGYVRGFSNLRPEAYAILLDRLGYCQQHVRVQVYAHYLPSRADVLEWVRGSLLTDYQQHLPPELFAEFVERYRQRLLPRLGEDRQPFLYAFKRLLLWASLEPARSAQPRAALAQPTW